MDLIERRWFVGAASAVLALAVVSGPYTAWGQQPLQGNRRIGFLAESGDFAKRKKPSAYHQAFLRGLADAGFVSGKNLTIEYRFADGEEARLAALAAELVAQNVEVIFSWSSGALAAAEATKTVPVVFVGITDPVANKLVKSLAHPGGNVTGISNQGLEVTGKRLELLKTAVPSARHVAVLMHRGYTLREQVRRDLEAMAPSLGVRVEFFEVETPDQIADAFTAMRAAGADSLLLQEYGAFTLRAKEISQRAIDGRLPAICNFVLFARAGCLMSYGQDFVDIFRRAGGYVARILKGTNPSDLPVEQPIKFDLVVNAKTAHAIGIAIPRSILLRADRVIE